MSNSQTLFITYTVSYHVIKKTGINLPHVLCCAQSLQSCPALCDTLDFSLSGYSVHGISQARILEWVAMPSSRGSSRLRD